MSNKSTGATFPTVFAHIMSVSHFGSSHTISNFSLLYLTVTCDQWLWPVESSDDG